MCLTVNWNSPSVHYDGIKEYHIFCIICYFCSDANQTPLFNSCLFLLKIKVNMGVCCVICSMSCFINWHFKIYFITNDTVMPPRRHSGTIWWSAQQTEGCWSIPEALQNTTLCWCKFSLWTARSRWGKPCHQVENRPVVLSQRQVTI